jgi:hypothetical protein
MIRRPIGAATLLLISACSGGASSLTSFPDPGTGLDYLIEHSSGPALSAATDRVFVVIDGERKEVFSGYGGEKVLLRSSGVQALPVIKTCFPSMKVSTPFSHNCLAHSIYPHMRCLALGLQSPAEIGMAISMSWKEGLKVIRLRLGRSRADILNMRRLTAGFAVVLILCLVMGCSKKAIVELSNESGRAISVLSGTEVISIENGSRRKFFYPTASREFRFEVHIGSCRYRYEMPHEPANYPVLIAARGPVKARIFSGPELFLVRNDGSSDNTPKEYLTGQNSIHMTPTERSCN